MAEPRTVDLDLREEQVQDLSSREAVAAFFASLGYNTSARTRQTPANLGISAETLANQIRHAELLADQDSLLQVYLFELTSVTIAAMRGLARAFRNRAGNFLLVLTSDYEHLDFVLLERFLPEATSAAAVGARQAGVRPRVLSVERLKPGRIEMRVLRRFTYTESDPLAQYEKLLSAYAVADWSEEHFNNRALFSDYYLLERLRETADWAEKPREVFLAFRHLFDDARGRWAGKPEGELRTALLEPAFRTLGLTPVPAKLAKDQPAPPDYVLRAVGSSKADLAVCLAYPWGRSLDSKDYSRDSETPEENPTFKVTGLLQDGRATWAVVTNGKLWRLYSARTHSRATNYYEVDLEEVLAEADPNEAFRYFWLLFRRQAFEPRTVVVEGQERTTTFLDQLLDGSEDYAKRLGERLKERVFEDIFPHLARGFVEHRKGQDGAEADVSQEALDQVFHGTLTFLYRLLFLLYAEARDLLPAREVRGYYDASLTRLKREVGQAAGDDPVEMPEQIKKAFATESTSLYDRLLGLFRVVDRGESSLNVPVYNGGLFISEPDPDDDSPEAHNARFILANKVPDRYLAAALDLLARDEDEKTFKRVFIDYKSLGVRQLGSIYEGLLEFHLRIAPEKMAVCKGKKTDEIIPYREAVKQERGILKQGRGKDAPERTLRKGAVYLENTRHERKATGSYYTPDYIVKYIVEHTVGPVLAEKFEAVRPKLREAQKAYHDAVKRREGFRKMGQEGDDPEKVANSELCREAVDELFDIKVLDPAMGSGHFLVEAVDVITDRMIDFLNAFPWNPVTAMLRQTRETILREMDEQGITIDPGRLTDVNLLKRHVLKRCIYGVDLNPMAVELAKVSLWLDCFTLGAPLSFLDHHLRCGNSLIGARVDEVQQAVEPVETQTSRVKVGAKVVKGTAQQRTLFGSRFAGLMLATDLMRQVGELSDVTAAQVAESRREYRKASDELAPFKRILDLYVAQWFVETEVKKGREHPLIDLLRSEHAEAYIRNASACAQLADEERSLVERAFAEAAQRRFFHWELEFPEVWYAKGQRKENPGFDAVVGNPPYDELSEHALGREISERPFLMDCPDYAPALGGRLNWFDFFIVKAVKVGRRSGLHSFIVPMSLLGDWFSRGLRQHLLQAHQMRSVEALPQKDDPTRRVFPDAKLPTCVYALAVGGKTSTFSVRKHPGRYIEADAPSYLAEMETLRRLDEETLIIPLVDEAGWRVLSGLTARPWLGTLEQCGAVPASGEIVFNEAFREYLTDDARNALVLRGGHVQRYEIVDEVKQGEPVYIRRAAFLKRAAPGSSAFHHTMPRVVYQECAAIDNWRRVIAAFLPAGSFCGHKICYFADYKCSELALLAVFNSRLLEWLVGVLSVTNSLPAYLIGLLPFPMLRGEAYVNLPAVSDLVAGIEGLGNDAGDQLGGGVGDQEPVLVRLAEQMIELNKQKQAETKRFLDWLVKQLHISPDSRDNEGVDALTGKTRLRNYLGDYQKGEEHLSFDDLLGILQKNRSRIGVGLSDSAFVNRLRTEYEASLARLLPTKERLAKTDWLIDQIVYRLYGLTEDEIKIVEGTT